MTSPESLAYKAGTFPDTILTVMPIVAGDIDGRNFPNRSARKGVCHDGKMQCVLTPRSTVMWEAGF